MAPSPVAPAQDRDLGMDQRVMGEVGRPAEWLDPAGQRRRAHRDYHIVRERNHDGAGRGRSRIVADVDIHGALVQIYRIHRGLETNVHIGIDFPEPRQPSHQPLGREAWCGMDGQDSADPGGRGVARGGIDAGKGGDDLGRIKSPRLRQDNRPVDPVEQGHPELLLQQLYLMAYRRRGNGQFFCCGREGTEPCCGLKRLNRLD